MILRRLIFTLISAKILSQNLTQNCDIKFANFDKLIALNSFPGSGNTWLRNLIEKSFGYYTGSVYMDQVLYYGGFKGEYTQPFSGHTIVQKIHHPRRDVLSNSYFIHGTAFENFGNYNFQFLA